MAEKHAPTPWTFRPGHARQPPGRCQSSGTSIGASTPRSNDVYVGYRSHAAATNGEDHIGDLDGTSLTLREACNKIIHAVDFRPIYITQTAESPRASTEGCGS